MDSWIDVKVFCDKYEVTTASIYVPKSTGSIPANVFRNKPRGRELQVNETFFIRRKEFKRKIWLQNHNYYYFLIGKMNQMELAELLHRIHPDLNIMSWYSYIDTGMWSQARDSITEYKIRKVSHLFNRYASWIVRLTLKKMRKKSRDMNILIDWRLDNEEKAAV